MKMKHRLLSVLLTLAVLLTFMPLLSDQADAATGAKHYKYRYDKSVVPEDYTKLGIAMFPGDTLTDYSEDTEYTENGCVYKGLYMGFSNSSIDTTACDTAVRTKEAATGEGTSKTCTGAAGLTIKGSRVVVVDGDDEEDEGPYIVKSNGKQVMHTVVRYKKIKMRTLGDYKVTYQLNGGKWAGGSNPNPETIALPKDDTVYTLTKPVKDGQQFDHWELSNFVNSSNEFGAASVSGNDLTVEGLSRDDPNEASAQLTKCTSVLEKSDGLVLTAYWRDSEDVNLVSSVSIDVTAPACGSDTVTPEADGGYTPWDWDKQTNRPQFTVTEGAEALQDITVCQWVKEAGSGEPYIGKFEGGKAYSVAVMLPLKSGYVFPEDTADISVTVNGTRCSVINRIDDDLITAYGTVTAAHVWGGYTVDKAATYAAAGSKSIHCKGCGAVKQGSKVSIPKLKVKATSITKLTAAKKAFTVKWKKAAGVTGYQIQYSLKSNFSGAKTVKIKKAATLSKKIAKLKSKKKYFVRIRAYKTVNKKTYYSAWSAKKTVKTK